MDLLSTSIVHDLRSPLGAVYAAAEILMSLDPGADSSESPRNQHFSRSSPHAGTVGGSQRHRP
jgi:K+-sensing histidine kinase KdpD